MSILQEKKNCWKIAPVTRGGFLVDSASYFRNLYEAMLQAEDSIFILGWDIDTRTKLIPHPLDPNIPTEFGAFLSYLVQQKKHLHIYILIWDFYSILAFERELFIKFKLGWLTSRRIQFHLDNEFPMGASHHQKIVVIDDQLAFCGGIDITSERWDTPAHRKKNKDRKNHIGAEYEPQHDVQMMVDGKGAYRLGQLSRMRWERATGKKIPIQPFSNKNHRFENLEWNYGAANVGISRTEPTYKNHPQVREVEQLFLDLIKTTKDHLYIENQYFTSEVVFQALKKSLSSKKGPEITLILLKESPYLVESLTMGSLQSISVRKLYESDPYGRLGIFSPMFDGNNSLIKIHSKVMIVDRHYARIGSANISNRSLGLDSECDLTLDGSQDKKLQASISELKEKLLGEHLNESTEKIKTILQKHRSINDFIRNHSKKGRHLEEMSDIKPSYNPLLQSELIDLESPLEIDRVLDDFGSKLQQKKRRFFQSIPFLIGTLLGGLLLLAAIWHYLPFPEGSEVKDFFLKFENQKIQPFWILSIYGIAGLMFIPVNILILATASIYGGLQAFVYATIGSMFNASLSYWVGYFLGKRTIQKIFSEQVRGLAQKMEEKGILPIIIIRLLPIAPYTMVNFIAGAFKISFKNYLLGTFLGMIPGTLFLIIFQRSFIDMIVSPTYGNVFFFALISLLIVLAFYSFRKRVGFPGRK